jgi:hypothetical protein
MLNPNSAKTNIKTMGAVAVTALGLCAIANNSSVQHYSGLFERSFLSTFRLPPPKFTSVYDFIASIKRDPAVEGYGFVPKMKYTEYHLMTTVPVRESEIECPNKFAVDADLIATHKDSKTGLYSASLGFSGKGVFEIQSKHELFKEYVAFGSGPHNLTITFCQGPSCYADTERCVNVLCSGKSYRMFLDQAFANY